MARTKMRDAYTETARRRLPESRLQSCGMSQSGADEASPVEGLTGAMGRLGHVPLWPRRGL